MAEVRGCEFPDDLSYDQELNVWFRDLGAGRFEAGLTAFGLALVGDLYMFNPRPVGREIEANKAFALVEVAKTVLSVRSPFACEVLEVNEPLTSTPITDHRWNSRPPPVLSATQKQWLMRTGALTTALRQLGTLELSVLTERVRSLTCEDSRVLGRPAGQPVWTREIVMRIDGIQCIVARSLTPLGASHGVWQGIRRLRTRPLADMLYHDASIRRSDFEVARLMRRSALFQTVQRNLVGKALLPLLARRSVFWRYDQPLLVAECFLPAFWERVQ